MTDKEKNRTEIERLKESGCASPIVICDTLPAFIDSMREESKPKFKVGQTITDPTDSTFTFHINKIEDGRYIEKEDEWVLVKEADANYELVEEPVSEDMEAEFLRAVHNLREQPTLSAWFRHFYNLGKQQMMKDAVDGVTKIDNNGNILLEANLNHLAKNCDLSQRVKLVIIKED